MRSELTAQALLLTSWYFTAVSLPVRGLYLFFANTTALVRRDEWEVTMWILDQIAR